MKFYVFHLWICSFTQIGIAKYRYQSTKNKNKNLHCHEGHFSCRVTVVGIIVNFLRLWSFLNLWLVLFCPSALTTSDNFEWNVMSKLLITVNLLQEVIEMSLYLHWRLCIYETVCWVTLGVETNKQMRKYVAHQLGPNSYAICTWSSLFSSPYLLSPTCHLGLGYLLEGEPWPLLL